MKATGGIMNKEEKELFKQIRAEKKKEYDLIYNSLYKKILLGICFVVMLIINFCGFEDEIIAYAIGVVIVIIFNIIWNIKQVKK